MLDFINMELVVQLHIFKNSYFVCSKLKTLRKLVLRRKTHYMHGFLGLIINRPIFFLLRDVCVLVLFEEDNQIDFLFCY